MDEFKIDEEHKLVLTKDVWIVHKNGVPQTTIPDKLFKYYSLSQNNLDALRNGYFFLSNPKVFNDPFDCCSNLIIEKRTPAINGAYTPLINDIKDKGITCFSKDGMNPLMWGHYSNSYKGFVLKFDSKLNTTRTPEIKNDLLTGVIYSSDPTPTTIKNSFSEYYQLVVKLKHWEYENEWRLIIDKNDTRLEKLYFDKNSVEEINLGYQIFHNIHSDTDLHRRYTELINIAEQEYPHALLYIVGPHETKFQLTKRRLIQARDIMDAARLFK